MGVLISKTIAANKISLRNVKNVIWYVVLSDFIEIVIEAAFRHVYDSNWANILEGVYNFFIPKFS